MPDRQASIVAQTPPLPSKRSRFKSESDTLSKQNLLLTPKSKSESKLRKVRKTPGPLLSKSKNNSPECLLSRSSVTKTLVFATEHLETVTIGKLNNSEPLVGVGKRAENTKPLVITPEQTYCADLDDEPILPTINVNIRNPVDKILEEEQPQPSLNLNFRLHDSDCLVSTSNMVSPSKINISKPSMCHDQNGDVKKASPLIPQKRTYKRKQREAQPCPRLTRASSLCVPHPEERSYISNPPTSPSTKTVVLQEPLEPPPVLLISADHLLPSKILSPKPDDLSLITVMSSTNCIKNIQKPLEEIPSDGESEEEISPPSTPTPLGFKMKTLVASDLDCKFNDSQTEILQNVDKPNNISRSPTRIYETPLDNRNITKHSDMYPEELPLYKPGIKFEEDLNSPLKSLPSKPNCDKIARKLLQRDIKKEPHSDSIELVDLIAPESVNGQVEITPERIVMEVVTFSRKMGIKKCAAKFNIPKNTIKEWIKEHSIKNKEAKRAKKSGLSKKGLNNKTKRNGSTKPNVESLSKMLSRNTKRNGKKAPLGKLVKKSNKQTKMGKATEVNERHGKFQSSFQKYEEVLEKEQEHAQFDLDDEWCNILEICEPGSDDDENTSDNKNNEMKSWEQIDLVKEEDTKADEIYHQIEKEKWTESDAKKSMKQKQKKNILSKKRSNLIQEETWETYDKNPDKTVSSTKNKDNHTTQKKKITKRQKTSNNKIIKSRMKQVINNVLEHDNNKIVIDSEEDNSNITEPSKLSKPDKCPKKLKEKWHSSKTKSVPVPATRNIEVNGIKEEAEKSQNIFKTVIQKSAALELNVQSIPIEKPKKKRKEANKKDKSASQPAAHQPGIKIDNNMSNLVDKIKPARGRPKKIRASGESMDATIEAVVRNSLLKYEESLVNARNESCKEIDLADLPLSQVHKLRKELKRSIFIQRKKEQYKEIFKKKKMNGTLKLKAKNTRIVMAKSFKKWKDFKIKRNKDQKENKTSITNRKPKIAGTCCKKNRLNKKKPALVSMEKQMASKLASVPLEKQIVSKPSPVTLEEQMASKPSPYHKHHIPLDQASYTYFDSDIARPSRHIVRPVRYLDFMKQSTENLAIMRLHQDGDKSMLPYDMENLDWNHDHSENTQAIYCYCGESGSWHTKMVRCSRCDQWFHERCLAPRPFAMPIISGDSFWLFVCSMCNIGSECLKRMDLTWTDLVHLAIFDLTSKTNRKFHDFDNDLMPFMLKNWAFFQLYKHFNSLTDEEKKLKTKETLFKSETFEQGSEAGQQEGIWGLRHYLPPPRPIYKVPDIGIISERTVLDEASVSSTVHPEPEPFLGIYNNFNIIYKDYVKPVVPEKPKKCIIKKKLTLKKSTQVNGCSSQVISHKNIQKSLKNKANVRSCKVKFKCLKLPEELKEMLTENCQKSKIEEKKPLPYEISKTLHQKGYPKVAMKFAEIIPPKKAIVVQALKAEQKSKKKRGPKSKKILDNHIPGSVEEKESSSDTSESSVLDALIPVKLDYYGENNPFILGSIEEQRAARNLICNRKLKEEDLTKCRSRIRKRKHRLFIEESRQLWKSKELVLENVSTQGQKNCVEEANQDLQYAGKYTTPSGEIKLLLLNPEKAEDESQMIDTKAYEQ